MASMNDILGVILGGGRGSRLYPLTRQRSKPAVPIAGKYRLIDIPLSNCINSGIYRIAVLTQFNSVSLHRHITNTYQFDTFHLGWVQVWAAEQTTQNADWYQGTADAVRKQLFEIQATRAPFVLILAGDHLYRMDYAPMARFHWDTNADITVAVQPCSRSDASRFGILKRDSSGHIVEFSEKPKDPAALARLVSRDDPERPYLSSMGIYLFKTSTLVDILMRNNYDDFGGQVIPAAIETHDVVGYDFSGYWEDIGTIRSFYETNLALARPDPPFDLYDPDHPIYSHPRYLPGSTVEDSRLYHVLLADGCMVHHADIENCIIGVRSQIGDGAKLRDTILMGADYYSREPSAAGNIPIGIGAGCEIQGAIIDKNASLGAGVVIRPFPQGTDLEREDWVVRDGIVVIPKDTIIRPGTYIGLGVEER